MGQQKTRHQRTKERREERAVRVLDTTKELVLKWGYGKTTLNDIAHHADIGKGTLFLHWPNRDALFVSLLRRERVGMLTETRDAIHQSSEQADLHGFVRHYVRVYARRPLLTALLLGDQTTLGRLADHKREVGSSTDMRHGFAAYLDTLREHGLVRDDMPTADLMYAFAATFYGFVAIRPLTPDELVPAEETIDTLCADSICRMLAPPTPPAPEQRKKASEITLRHIDQMLEISQEKYQDSLTASASAER